MNQIPSRTRRPGFRWPAEWERHSATWLAWPHNRDTWPGIFERIPDQFERFVRAVADHEPVRVLASPSNHDAATLARLARIENVQVVDIPTNDAWVRDYGPTFLRDGDGGRGAVVWRYNSWGGKYPPFEDDAAAAARIANEVDAELVPSTLTIEGGAIEGNGCGDLLTTESCVLTASRNPGVTAEEVGRQFETLLGAQRVHWLPQSHLQGDDTDGHIDQLARFVSPTQIVVATPQPDDQAHLPLIQNKAFLENARSANGEPFDVHALPLPRPLLHDGNRLPASYCNFYICNGAVIVPQFGQRAADEYAAATLQQLFDDRELVTLDATDLAWGLGAYHCLSQPEF